ncbi:MAG: SRPBCC family protein [Polyangia bacterium]
MKKALGMLAVVLGAFALFVATRPTHFKVARARTMHAPAAVIFAQLDDFHQWAAWSPWDKMDPTMRRTYGGPDRGVGATYAWSGNDKVGSGTMTVAEARPSSRVVVDVDFEKPMQAHNIATFALMPHGEGNTLVTWSMEGDNSFIGKAFGVFVNMDKMLGEDFDRGLDTLESLSESKAEETKQAAVVSAQATTDAGIATPKP